MPLDTRHARGPDGTSLLRQIARVRPLRAAPRSRSRNPVMHPTALAALAWAFLPGPPTVPGSATRLLARVRPLSALDEVDPFELELERQSEVVEVLRRVSDPALSDLESAKKSDIVSLGLLRDLQTGEGSVRLEFVVPQDAAASGAVDRLRVKCEALLQAELPWVRAVQADARVVSDSAPTQLSPDGTLGAAGGGEEAPGVAGVGTASALTLIRALTRTRTRTPTRTPNPNPILTRTRSRTRSSTSSPSPAAKGEWASRRRL